MAVRRCPKCLAVISAGEPAAFSDAMECPRCKTRLEVATGSRMLASWMGLAAGFVVWRLTYHGFDTENVQAVVNSASARGMLGWALPVVYCFLAFSIVSALATMFTADLRIKPAEPASEPAPAGGDGGAHR